MKDVKVGLIGAGQIAKTHVLAMSSIPMLYNLSESRPSFSVLAEATDSLAEEAARRFGFAGWTSDWRKVTGSSDVELVDIVTPTYLHHDPAMDAAERGKNIICEKPLATTAKQSREIFEAAERAGVVNMVGFNYRRLPAVMFCKELAETGKLGEIYQFTSSFMEDWANADFGLTWRFNSESAGAGVLADLGSHIIDLARFIIGDIASVSGTRKTFIEERSISGTSSRGKSDVDDTALALLKFKSGTLGRIEASWCALGRRVNLEFEVNGSEGSVYYNLERPNEVQVYSKNDQKTVQGYRTVLMGPIHPYGKGMVFPAAGTGMGYEESIINEFYDLFSSIQDRSKHLSPTFYDGWRVNQAIEAIIESSEKESWVKID